MSRARHHGRDQHQHEHRHRHRFTGGGADAEADACDGASNVAYFTYPTIRGGSFVVAAEYAEKASASLSGGKNESGAYFTLPELDGGCGDGLFDDDQEDEEFLYGGRVSGRKSHGPQHRRKSRGQAHGHSRRPGRGESSVRGGAAAEFSGGVEAGVGDAGQLFFTVPVLGGESQQDAGQYDGDDAHAIFGG